MADIPSKWRRLLDRDDVLVLDTETTGLTENSEVLDIGILNTKGETLLDAVVKPAGRIPKGASDVHGLTRSKLKAMDAQPWAAIHDKVMDLLVSAKLIVVYNADFDYRMLEQTCRKAGLKMQPARSKWICAMLDYAEFRGERTGYGSFRWHKLGVAFKEETKRRPVGAHRALGDCKLTLDLMRSVSVKQQPEPEPMPERRPRRYRSDDDYDYDDDYDDDDDYDYRDYNQSSGRTGCGLLLAAIGGFVALLAVIL